jgi:hypothetical protein
MGNFSADPAPSKGVSCHSRSLSSNSLSSQRSSSSSNGSSSTIRRARLELPGFWTLPQYPYHQGGVIMFTVERALPAFLTAKLQVGWGGLGLDCSAD